MHLEMWWSLYRERHCLRIRRHGVGSKWRMCPTTINLQEQSQAALASPPPPEHVVQEQVKPQCPQTSSAALLQYAPICCA